MKSLIKIIALMTAIVFSAMAYGETSLKLNLTTTKEGELKNLLDDRMLIVEDLAVKGVLGEEDFDVLWQSSFYGKLKRLDLSEAVAQIPDCAFFREDVQGDPSSDSFKAVKLKAVLLSPNTYSIGYRAFYGVPLESINWTDIHLFEIGGWAFAYTDLRDVRTRPERIYEGAFAHSKVEDVQIVAVHIIGDGVFEGCSNLKKVCVPSALHSGERVFYGCDLGEIEFLTEDYVYSFEKQYFAGNKNLHSVAFEPFIEVKEDAFEGCGLETLIFNEGVMMFSDSFRNLPTLRKIYCPTELPPFANFYDYDCWRNQWWDTKNPGYENQHPFGGSTPRDVTVYVPVGCVDTYRNAPGWDYFSNFVETTDFPTTSSGLIIRSGGSAAIRNVAGGVAITPEVDSEYAVYNLDGVVVASGKAASGKEITIPCPAGISLVRVGEFTQKIIVK